MRRYAGRLKNVVKNETIEFLQLYTVVHRTRSELELDGIISRASGCRHRINTSVFNVSSVPRIGARSIGASLKGRIRPSHSNIISMEAVMDPAEVPTVCFIRKYEVRRYE